MNRPAEGRVVLFSLATCENKPKFRSKESVTPKFTYTSNKSFCKSYVRTYQVHIVIMSPWHQHIVEATSFRVHSILCIVFSIVVVWIAFKVLSWSQTKLANFFESHCVLTIDTKFGFNFNTLWWTFDSSKAHPTGNVSPTTAHCGSCPKLGWSSTFPRSKEHKRILVINKFSEV